MARRRVLLALAPCLLLNGCCSLARLFCGPDDSRWVSVSYDTPRDGVATLLEAIRRDAPDVVYSCLSAGFRRANNLDSVAAQIAWERLKEQVPGLHLAGYAEIPEPRLADNGATFVIDVEGYRLQIDLVRESYRQLVYSRPNGTLGESRVPLQSFNTVAQIERIADEDFDRSRMTLRPIEFEHEGLDEVPLAAIQRAGLIRHWKVAALRQLEE